MKKMNRKDFLKSLGIAGVATLAVPVLARCASDDDSTTSGGGNTTTCSVTNTETEGPYPTNSPSSLVRTNIVGDRTGIGLTVEIAIQNVNNNCVALEGVLVDVWHCDKDGNYSEYNAYENNSTHFLRGRQITDANGVVNFTSIFPGWYTGRATHIHVHVYSTAGNSLLVTQIAFPEGDNSAVYNVNVNGSSYGYTKGMSGYIYNASDNVFSDGVENEICTISGSNDEGYALSHTIKVSA